MAEVEIADGQAQLRTFLNVVKNGSVELRDAENGNLLRTIVPADPERGSILSGRFMADRGFLLLGRDDGEVELWDVTKGTELLKFNTETRINDIAFSSPDGVEAISTNNEGTVLVLDLRVGLVLSVLRAPAASAPQISTSRDGRLALGQGYYRSACLWDVPIAALDRSALVQTACRDLLLHTGNGGRDNFAKLTPEELAAVPALDAVRDYQVEGDVCAPVSPWKRLYWALKGY